MFLMSEAVVILDGGDQKYRTGLVTSQHGLNETNLMQAGSARVSD
jgi:hypothetical protein